MIPDRDESAAGLQDAEQLPGKCPQITRMVHCLPGEHQVEALVSKWQSLPEGLEDLDIEAGCGSHVPDGAGTDKRARIRFERRD